MHSEIEFVPTIDSPPKTCAKCQINKDDVQLVAEPYMKEVHNTVIMTNLCTDCYCDISQDV